MSSTDVETQVVETAITGGDSLTASSSLADSLAGVIDRIGRYVLLDRLGRGAFGTVWAAFDPELDRKVAIKIVHGRRGSGETQQARAHDDLLQEAQLLAQLSHPNVVVIHDVGRLEDALIAGALGADAGVGVYIVMEYLDGPTLADWLRPDTDDKHGDEANTQAKTQAKTQAEAGVEARTEAEPTREVNDILRVFAEAGSGLQAAHARDLIHLDFKPGNVMLGVGGRVRVLDFGLARVGRRVPRSEEDAERTQIAGTPAYMAPEQHAGEAVDARADQYAFCASLWEALHGRRPFLGASAEEIAEQKREGPPAAPRGSIAPPHVLAALERGMAVRRDDRFPDMASLLAVLADDPALRRRQWMIGAVLVAALFAAGFGLARASDPASDPCELPDDQFAEVWDDARRAEVEAGFAATEASFADQAFARSSQALDAHLERWVDVRTEVCKAGLVDGDIPVEAMSEQMLCLDRQLRQVAELSATLAEADAEIVARATDSVLQLAEPASCRVNPDEPEQAVEGDRGELLALEDAIAEAQVAGTFGRYQDGLAAADLAAERAEELDAPHELARAQRERAFLLYKLGRFDEARDAAWAALAAAGRAGDPTAELAPLLDLIAIHTKLSDYPAAETLVQLVRARVDPRRQPELAAQLHRHAGTLYHAQERWDEALASYEAGRELVVAELGERHPEAASFDLVIANTYLESGRDLELAKQNYERALALWAEVYGPNHPRIADGRLNLSGVYFRTGQFAKAIELLESALALHQQILEPDHPTFGVHHQNLGALYSMVGEYDQALEHSRRALAITGARLGEDHPDYATVERNTAALLMFAGRYKEAVAHLRHATEVYDRAHEPTDSRVMASHGELAEALWWLGDFEGAREELAIAEQGLAAVEPTERRRVTVWSMQIMVRIDEGRFTDALPIAERLVQFMVGGISADHPDTARARVQLAEVLRGLGRHEEARSELESALSVLAPASGDPHPHAWLAEYELARLEFAVGKREAGIAQLEQALDSAQGPQGSRANAAVVQVELAKRLAKTNPARAQELAKAGRAGLEASEVRPDLVAEAEALLGADAPGG